MPIISDLIDISNSPGAPLHLYQIHLLFASEPGSRHLCECTSRSLENITLKCHFRKPKEETPAPSEDEGDMSPTPKKPTRSTRTRKAPAEVKPKTAAGRRKKAVKATTPPAESSEDEDAADAACSAAGGNSTPERAASVAASSDDFGGYSD